MENQAELEEKTRLINQVLELQHTLEGRHVQPHSCYLLKWKMNVLNINCKVSCGVA